MSEQAIQTAVVKHARRAGVLARKLDFGQGWPDFMFLHSGRVLFIEFKRPGERPTPLQVHMHTLLQLAGFRVCTVDDVDIGVTLVDNFKENKT